MQRNYNENHAISNIDYKRSIQPVLLTDAQKIEIQSHRDHMAELARERTNRLARKRNAVKKGTPIFDRKNTLGYKINTMQAMETAKHNMLWTSLFASVEVN